MPWLAGVDRSEIDWGPKIDPKKCVSCSLCLNCGKNVFEWVEGKAVVARRDDCVVGCMTCGNLCQGGAISFPPVDELRKAYRDKHIWKHVKVAMVAAGKIPEES
jgi:NAD-dependent dihydropyrimidine dehydrogenase PreA subunit